MSQKFSNERPRSASIKPTRNNITMPQEYIKEQSYPKAPISSSIKIEDKLMNNQIATKKRLEALKKNLEQEDLLNDFSLFCLMPASIARQWAQIIKKVTSVNCWPILVRVKYFIPLII